MDFDRISWYEPRMWGFMRVILFSLIVFLTCFSARAQLPEYDPVLSMPEPEWRLITDKDWELEKYKVFARRGHPEGRIRNIMKTYAIPSRVRNPDRNLFNFKRMHKKGMGMLDTFLMRMKYTPLSMVSDRERLVYWINVRNILIVQAMADESNYEKIKINRGTPDRPSKLWTKKRFENSGQHYSIHDIETEILKLSGGDPRVIYALYQGSMGGPTLPASGFTAQFLEAQLDEAARHYIGNKLYFQSDTDQVRIPEVFDWYKDSLFGGSDSAIKAHLLDYAQDEFAAALGSLSAITFRPMDYEKDSTNVRGYFKKRVDPEHILHPDNSVDIGQNPYK